MTKRYVIACRSAWFWDEWQATPKPPGDWTEIREDTLDVGLLEDVDPRYVFFPHWSRIVPPEVFERWESVVFHSTPVPYGRGGSPVQNMIVRGHDSTQVTALRMEAELDAGPVYMQEPVSLAGGGDEIFIRINRTIAGMIPRIAAEEPEPTPQEGEPVNFKRRTPEESRMPGDGSLDQMFDFIRMLDAEGYPPAFAELGEWRIEFTRPALRRGRIDADVRITRRSSKPPE
jgi:methionyl-tRNA formyltransferase